MTTQTDNNEVYIGRFLLAAVYSDPWIGVDIRVGEGETHADVWATGSDESIKVLLQFAPTTWDESKYEDLDVPECLECGAKRNLWSVIARGVFICSDCHGLFFDYGVTENDELVWGMSDDEE